jgi:hypothetical protein
MPDIKLSDNASLSITFGAATGSAFNRYVASTTPISIQLKEKQPTSGGLAQFIPSGLSFTDKFRLGGATPTLTVKDGVEGTASLKTGTMFDPNKDDFGDSLTIPDGQAYLSAGFKTTVDAGVTDTIGQLKFGVDATSVVTLTNYALFPVTQPVGAAMKQVLQNFVIPGDLDDIRTMQPNTIATAEGSGAIKFSFKGSYPLLSLPMATVAIGPLKGFSAGSGGLSLAVTAGVSGGYQIRVRKLDSQTCELSYQKKRGTSFQVTAQAQFAPAAAIGGFDVLKPFMQAITKEPVVDKDTFAKNTGLTDDQIAAIAAAVKAGIDRSLCLSLTTDVNLASEDAAAFSYQIDLNQVKPGSDAAKAVDEALLGDLSRIEFQDFPGITRLRTVLSSLREQKYTFKVNLLGIYNYGSVTDLLSKGRMVVDHDTGVISILDQASASRVQFSADLIAKPGKQASQLRAVIATGVTMTAAYSFGKSIPDDPDLKCNCWFFDENQRSKHADFTAYVRDVTTFGLSLSVQAAQQFQATAKLPEDTLGASTLLMQSTYGAPAFRAMFLDDSQQPKTYLAYEKIAREALAMQLVGDSNSLVRIHALKDPDLYLQFVRVGDKQDIFQILDQQNIKDDTVKEFIFDDSVMVRWWASAMADVAQRLKKLIDFRTANPKIDANDKTFKKIRQQLNSAMQEVASRSSDPYVDHLGGPWGLRVMAESSGFHDSSSATVVSSHFAFTASRNPLPPAPSTAAQPKPAK